ncbi:hypothetical protein QE375_000364 [Microbacterium foliorum]|uniref:Uncharacterized protein n=1 Tax=Microbacterium foliorum TaxID=104336 RepID=A0ABU1HL91_9MICO|nr:hypothetical protein [Microbacterium foliorum]
MRGTFAACFRQGLPDDDDALTSDDDALTSDDDALTADSDAEGQWSQVQDPPPQHPASAETCA